MDAGLCRQLNIMSLEQLASYLGEDVRKVMSLYEELLGDQAFLEEINSQIQVVREHYTRGIFQHERLDTVDWFAIQRILLYVLIRLYKPVRCLETGVFYGGNTCFMLHALRRNGSGELVSIDLPGNVADRSKRHHWVGDSEHLPSGLDIGFLVPKDLRKSWTLVRGDSHTEIPRLNGIFDFYIHDSEHSYDFIKKEMTVVWDRLSPGAVAVADDLDWSNGFFSFCDEKRLYPLIITDNGKSGLRIRTGIIKLDHAFNKRVDVVGSPKRPSS
jgi:predicted O-methyltransferase YrrM